MTILLRVLLLSFCFDWEDISNTRDISETYRDIQTLRISSKMLRCASYWTLFSVFGDWWNTVSRVKYITSNTKDRVWPHIHIFHISCTNVYFKVWNIVIWCVCGDFGYLVIAGVTMATTCSWNELRKKMLLTNRISIKACMIITWDWNAVKRIKII